MCVFFKKSGIICKMRRPRRHIYSGCGVVSRCRSKRCHARPRWSPNHSFAVSWLCLCYTPSSVSKLSRRAECSVDPLASLSSCDRPTWDRSQEVRTTPMFTNRLLVCRDCQQEFVFTAGEQEFYESRGLTNAPSRCPACRAEHKAQGETRSWSRSERTGVRSERPMYAATCANCGRETQVPFQPRTDRPVYCPDCYQDRRRDHRIRWKQPVTAITPRTGESFEGALKRLTRK